MTIRLYFLPIFIGLLIEINGKPVHGGQLSNRINHLLNIIEAEKRFNNVLEAYINSDSTLSIYKSEIKSLINKFLSFQILRPHIIEIYRDLYTLSDINEMIKFYSSKLGKKLLEKETQAGIRISLLIIQKFQEQMPQIISWLQQRLIINQSINSVNITNSSTN